MTDREKALAIDGYVRFLMLKGRLFPKEGGTLATLGAEHAGLSPQFVRGIGDESDAFTKTAILATKWPLVGGWLARRASRRQIAMTDREKAFVLDMWGRIYEFTSGVPHSRTAAVVARAARKMGLTFELLAQVSQESSAFIGGLSSTMQSGFQAAPSSIP